MPLHITSTTVSANTKSVRIRPTAKAELKDLIKLELVRQGPDADLNHIDVSQITDMSWLFNELNPGNIKIDKWDVSNVTNMSWMFSFCKKFNADLSKWRTRVSNVTNMQSMFLGCEEFNCDLSKWGVSKVKNMNGMFTFCSNFTGQSTSGTGLSCWNTNNVTDMTGMFDYCESLIELPKWFNGRYVSIGMMKNKKHITIPSFIPTIVALISIAILIYLVLL